MTSSMRPAPARKDRTPRHRCVRSGWPLRGNGRARCCFAVDDGVAERAGESLHEDAVDARLAHPLEMPQHGRRLEGAEDFGGPAVGEADPGDEPLFGAQFGEIGPEIDAEISAGRRGEPIPPPVMPAAIGPVAFTSEPALVAAQHLASQRRWRPRRTPRARDKAGASPV